MQGSHDAGVTYRILALFVLAVERGCVSGRWFRPFRVAHLISLVVRDDPRPFAAHILLSATLLGQSIDLSLLQHSPDHIVGKSAATELDQGRAHQILGVPSSATRCNTIM